MPTDSSDDEAPSKMHARKRSNKRSFVGFLRGGCPRGGGNWGTLRIPIGKIGEV